MNATVARILVHCYPRSWRERYGVEFEALLQDSPGGLGEAIKIVGAALHERAFPSQLHVANEPPHSFSFLVKRPGAFLPLAMSLTALALVLVHIALFGTAREADEGATAHLWQLLMAGQMPVLVFFALRWLPRAPRQALCVMALQFCAALASLAPVFFLNL